MLVAWYEEGHLYAPLKIGRDYEANVKELDFEMVVPLERGLEEEALDYFEGMDWPLFC